MAKRRKLTPLQAQYRQQVYRLRRIEAKLMKEGAALPERTSLQMPKRVTKQAIARLKATKPKDIRKKAEFMTRDGRIVGYNEWKKIKKQEEEWGWYDDGAHGGSGGTIDWVTEVHLLIDNFWDQINALPTGIDSVFQNWFAMTIYQHGNLAIGYWLKTMSPDLAEKWQSCGYDYKATMALLDSEIYTVLSSQAYKEAMDILDRSDYTEWDV